MASNQIKTSMLLAIFSDMLEAAAAISALRSHDKTTHVPTPTPIMPESHGYLAVARTNVSG
jgi:poly(3-hydroxybutyrate) depolymerase